MNANYNNTFVISVGSEQTDIDEASVDIDDMIDMLREAKRMGAEFVTLESDNLYSARFFALRDEGDMASDLFPDGEDG